MSAYLVADKTINRIVTWLSREVSVSHFTIDQLAREYGIDLVSATWEETLAKRMFELNRDGVTARYDQGTAEQFRARDFVYAPEPCHSLVQVFKSLECFLYQCDEGTVPETPLCQFFEAVENYLAVKIVMGLPEYDQAQWA